jgi:hypothetical protein
MPSETMHGRRKKYIADAWVKGIIGYDWKLQSGIKGSDLKVTWLTVVVANSIKCPLSGLSVYS